MELFIFIAEQLGAVSSGINIQSLFQWIFMGIISLITTVLGIKYGLSNLEKKFDKLDEEMREGFKNSTSDLKELRNNINTEQAEIKLLTFRIDKIEKKLEI